MTLDDTLPLSLEVLVHDIAGEVALRALEEDAEANLARTEVTLDFLWPSWLALAPRTLFGLSNGAEIVERERDGRRNRTTEEVHDGGFGDKLIMILYGKSWMRSLFKPLERFAR